MWLLVVQVGIFQVVFLQRTPEQAYSLVQSLQPFVPFRDASCGPPSFHLTVLDCIRVRQQLQASGGPSRLPGSRQQLLLSLVTAV